MDLEIGKGAFSLRGVVRLGGLLILTVGMIALIVGWGLASSSALTFGGVFVALGIGGMVLSSRFEPKRGTLRLGEEGLDYDLGKKQQRVLWSEVSQAEWLVTDHFENRTQSAPLMDLAVKALVEKASDAWLVKLWGPNGRELIALKGPTFYAPIEAKKALEATLDGQSHIAQTGRS
jgi:hypothetical protein